MKDYPLRDHGTYWLRVEFDGGVGFLHRWGTGHRYMMGSGDFKPLEAQIIHPSFESEDHLFQAMVYSYTEGNYACDCNRISFLLRANQMEEPDEIPCGDSMILDRLTAIRPDLTEVTIYERSTK